MSSGVPYLAMHSSVVTAMLPKLLVVKATPGCVHVGHKGLWYHQGAEYQGQVSSRLGWTQGFLLPGGACACQPPHSLSRPVSPEMCCLAPLGVGLIYRSRPVSFLSAL